MWRVRALHKHYTRSRCALTAARPLVGPAPLRFSEDAALEVVTGALSLVGAAGGVLRAALTGSDPRLFLQVRRSLPCLPFCNLGQ